MIQIDLSKLQQFVSVPYEMELAPRLHIVHGHLQKGNGVGGEFTGWVHLPESYDRAEFARIEQAAQKIRSDSQALVVIGIGGSYLGARGVIECLCSPNYNLKKKDTPNIYFIGNGLSSDQLSETMELLAVSWLAENDFAESVGVRFDKISMIVVGEDRALLRHHINAFGEA